MTTGELQVIGYILTSISSNNYQAIKQEFDKHLPLNHQFHIDEGYKYVELEISELEIVNHFDLKKEVSWLKRFYAHLSSKCSEQIKLQISNHYKPIIDNYYKSDPLYITNTLNYYIIYDGGNKFTGRMIARLIYKNPIINIRVLNPYTGQYENKWESKLDGDWIKSMQTRINASLHYEDSKLLKDVSINTIIPDLKVNESNINKMSGTIDIHSDEFITFVFNLEKGANATKK